MNFKPIFLIAILVLMSCDSKKIESIPDGVYASIGYGRLILIQDGSFQLFDVSSNWCDQRINGFLKDFDNALFIRDDTLNFKVGITNYQYLKMSHLPDICSKKYSYSELNDPKFNFEVLEETFSNNYAYFNLRKVNWDSLRIATRKEIDPLTTEIELYRILKDMLNTFGDDHISLNAPENLQQTSDSLNIVEKTNSKTEIKKYDLFQVAKLIGDQYLQYKEYTKNSRFVRWGMINDQFGYIQINSMSAHANLNISDTLSLEEFWREYENETANMTVKEWEQGELQGISEIMNKAIDDLWNTEAIVLDVRFNQGGQDLVAMEIIRHFNNKRQVGFTKKAKGVNDSYSPAQKIYLEGSNKAYTKPVLLLTSKQTASAAEILVLSSLSLPTFTRLGANTRGIFSDELTKRLPIGWGFGLSNEIYLDRNGTNYEGVGISPDIDLGYPYTQQIFLKGFANAPAKDFEVVLHEINSITDSIAGY